MYPIYYRVIQHLKNLLLMPQTQHSRMNYLSSSKKSSKDTVPKKTN